MRTRILAVIDNDDVKHIDTLVKSGTFASRGHYMRQAVQHFRQSKEGKYD